MSLKISKDNFYFIDHLESFQNIYKDKSDLIFNGLLQSVYLDCQIISQNRFIQSKKDYENHKNYLHSISNNINNLKYYAKKEEQKEVLKLFQIYFNDIFQKIQNKYL